MTNFAFGISEAEQKCLDEIPEDATQVERMTMIKECNTIGIGEGSVTQEVDPEITQAEDYVKDCEYRYETYEKVGENTYKKVFLDSLANSCIKLYQDEIWNYVGDDRFQKLGEKMLEITREHSLTLKMEALNPALAECDKFKYLSEIDDCKLALSTEFKFKELAPPDFSTSIYQEKIELLENENVQLKEELQKKDAVLMEQLRVIMDLANKLTSTVYEKLVSLFSF